MSQNILNKLEESNNFVIIKYASFIKLNDIIAFRINSSIKKCKVINIYKGIRRSRENGYPYEFTGECVENGNIYKVVYSRDILKYY
jgi:hypothetical protein